ncbi:MAG: ZIP family metal transporter [Ignavibacteriales bacterium]|nr:ZIP family metal transporter [Ignavibacteriales bacterium]
MLKIILLGLLASLAELFGGIVVVRGKKWLGKIQEYLLALSAGFLLALVFFELIPESIKSVGAISSLYILIGFSLLHFFEHTIVGHLHFGEETHQHEIVKPFAGISAVTGLAIHAFFDGLSISSAMLFNEQIGILVFIAVLLHKFPEGLTVASITLAANRPTQHAIFAAAGLAIATFLGIVAVFFFSNINENFVGIAFAFSAGAATYVGASDLIPEINRSHNRVTPLVVFGGMILFYVSTLLLK